ncbi:GNAT family N-acetyltransferase [Longispora sp. NPDC051575]|uniref:GNAT family N-acetyltransferase n=1 Tax=Longispora sp. NPDC051575 TaxID=3154943 RepID=UPI0034245AAA
MRVELHKGHGVEPPGWAAAVSAAGLHAAWAWPVLRARAGRRGVRALLRAEDGSVAGLAAWRGVPGATEVLCPASSVLPGVAADPGVWSEALRAVGGALGGAVLLRQLQEAHLPAVLRGPAVVRRGLSVAVFDNHFDSFDGYLAGLGKGRRNSLTTQLRRIDADPGLVCGFGRDALPEPAEVVGLVAATARRQRTGLLPAPSTGPALAAALLADPTTHWLTYRDRDGRLLACAYLLDHAEWPVLGSWGALAPEDGGRKHLWFHMLTACVRWCVAEGRAGVVMGKGSEQTKRTLGFRLRPQWTVLAHASALGR